MKRTGFEKLRVYQLAEEIGDLAWEVVIKWNRLAQDTVGIQLKKLRTALELILRKEQAVEVLLIIGDLPKLQEAPFLK